MRRSACVFASGLLCLILVSCAAKPGDENPDKAGKGPKGSAQSPAADQSGPPKGVIDAIEGEPVTGGMLSLRGWAAAPSDGAPLKKVEIVLDGKVVAQASTGLPRQDVVNVYHRPDWLKSGWTAEIYLNNVKPGQHKVDVIAYDSRSMKTILDGSKMVTVRNGDQKSPT